MSAGPFDFALLSPGERNEYVRLRERPSTAGRERMRALEAKATVPPAVVASAQAAASPWELDLAVRAGARLSRLTASERDEWLALVEMRSLLGEEQARRLAELTRKARRPRPQLLAAHNAIFARRRRLGARPAASPPPTRRTT